ncbi:MAG: OmpH family outer membrane protein, partial [Paramuribaculum sp.]|nr:OmpH family outer membrane protein [Paramuribaculum sp.]
MNIKKTLIALVAVIGCALAANAQKFALVDMEYVLSNLPSYEVANNQLEQLSQRYQKEVENVAREAETMYNNYKSQMPFLT